MSKALGKRIRVGDVEVRYWEEGVGESVLLIHGLGASIETWEPTLPVLAKRHRAIAVDLVGFGYTDKPAARYTVDYLVDFLCNFMDTVGVDRAAIVGHSMGGALALRMAIRHPQRVGKLVLVDAAGLSGKASLPQRLLSLPLVGELFLSPKREKTRAALLPFFFDKTLLTDAFVELNYYLISQPGARRAYLSTVRNLASITGPRRSVLDGITERLEEIKVPTLVIWGSEDELVPVAHAEEARERIKGARIRILPACGHLPMLEQPAAFTGMVADFLAGGESPGREAARRQSYLEGVLAAAPDAIVTMDIEHHILEWNAGAERLFGYTRDEVAGRYIDPLLTDSAKREEATDLTQQVIRGEEVLPFETVRLRKDGTSVHVIVAGSPIFIADELVGAVAVYTDVSALQRVQHDLLQRNRDLDAFAHTVAHDLKGPLSNIYGYARVLEQTLSDSIDPVAADCTDAIAQSAYRMNASIDALLLLAGLRDHEIVPEPLAMGEIVAGALERLAYTIQEAGAQVELPETWPVALGYGPWVDEVWTNYLSNGLKYGGNPPRLTLGSGPASDDKVRFWVHDTGGGLSQEEQDKLFQPFTRLAQVPTEGHGLGLSIARRIIERLGGDVGVESTPGQGSTFYFELPGVQAQTKS